MSFRRIFCLNSSLCTSLILIRDSLVHSPLLPSPFNSCNVASADHPVPKVLYFWLDPCLKSLQTFVLSFNGVSLEHGSQYLKNLFLTDRCPKRQIRSSTQQRLPIEFVQTFTVITPTKHEIVSPWRFSDACELCHPRSSTSVRTASHSHDNTRVSKADLEQCLLQFGDERRKISLAFSHCQTTSSHKLA